ncbi:hypothetical protein C0992_001417 [Termitomyces sp. T32_za158]|nr:hypothetical protein C0992_001417 [Termitomyces sp. T32_za158]
MPDPRRASAALEGADKVRAWYADAAEECKEHLARIKDLENDLGVVVHDWEIFPQGLSVLQLSVDIPFSSGLSPLSSTLLLTQVTASLKLGEAHAELQACEATLAQKERAAEVRQGAEGGPRAA